MGPIDRARGGAEKPERPRDRTLDLLPGVLPGADARKTLHDKRRNAPEGAGRGFQAKRAKARGARTRRSGFAPGPEDRSHAAQILLAAASAADPSDRAPGL